MDVSTSEVSECHPGREILSVCVTSQFCLAESPVESGTQAHADIPHLFVTKQVRPLSGLTGSPCPATPPALKWSTLSHSHTAGGCAIKDL